MKILITGGAGFVGRHFIKELYKNNHIVSVDIKDQIADSWYSLVTTYRREDCREFFKYCTQQFDLVIHLAAIVGGRTMIEGNPITVATDLSIDAEMFNWAVRTKQKRIVYFSSSAAYPIALQDDLYQLHETDIDLSAIKNPDMTYGWSKLTGEMLAEHARKQGVNVHVFRPFSGYGSDQDLDYPFPSFIERAKKIKEGKLKQFDIWGSGDQVRDFIHIDDIVCAVLKAVELDIQEPINLGNARPTTFKHFAQMCMEAVGKTVKIKVDESKPVGVKYRFCDNTRLLKFYLPRITLEEGIQRALNEKA